MNTKRRGWEDLIVPPRVTPTDTQRWHAHRGTAGQGHLDQGRFKSFPVQDDNHFDTVGRYVERNAARQFGGSGRAMALVQPVANGLWGRAAKSLMATWPVARPRHWVDFVNQPQTEAELAAIRRCNSWV